MTDFSRGAGRDVVPTAASGRQGEAAQSQSQPDWREYERQQPGPQPSHDRSVTQQPFDALFCF